MDGAQRNKLEHKKPEVGHWVVPNLTLILEVGHCTLANLTKLLEVGHEKQNKRENIIFLYFIKRYI